MATIRPTFGPLSLEEGSLLLQGVYAMNVYQLSHGQRGILGALVPGSAGPGRRRLRYIRRDPLERWQNIREIWKFGGGDCEDLAAAVAAELTVMGIPARPVVYRVRPGLAHVVVQQLRDGKLLDPSKIGGMGESPLGGLPYRPDLARLARNTGLAGVGCNCGGRCGSC